MDLLEFEARNSKKVVMYCITEGGNNKRENWWNGHLVEDARRMKLRCGFTFWYGDITKNTDRVTTDWSRSKHIHVLEWPSPSLDLHFVYTFIGKQHKLSIWCPYPDWCLCTMKLASSVALSLETMAVNQRMQIEKCEENPIFISKLYFRLIRLEIDGCIHSNWSGSIIQRRMGKKTLSFR